MVGLLVFFIVLASLDCHNLENHTQTSSQPREIRPTDQESASIPDKNVIKISTTTGVLSQEY